MNYAEAAIVRARTVLSLFVVIMLAGIYSYAVIPLEANPDVSVPVVLITVPHEGITPQDSERLRSELLASYSEGAEVVELRSELDAKLAEVQALEGKLTDVETAKGELESNLNEVTEEYRRMFDEFQVDGSEPSHDAAEA